MNCTTSCILAGAFLISMFYTMFTIDKSTLVNSYLRLLNDKEKQKYFELVTERRNIYLQGFALGFVISLGILYYLHFYRKEKVSRFYSISIILGVSFTINYFYYIIHPKSDYMLRYLDTQEERDAWLNIYRAMQLHYHLGFALGLLFMVFVANAFH